VALTVCVRQFAWPDIEGIARLHRAAERVDRAGRNGDAVSLAQRWRRLEGDGEAVCLVAERGGMLVGYALCSRVPGTEQCVLDGLVHPEWRRRGIGRRLLEGALEGAGRIGRWLDVRVRDDEAAGEAFCRAVGLDLVRVWQRMWLEPLRVPQFGFPQGYSSRAYRPHADEATFAALVNETMAEHWGSAPMTPAEVARMARQSDFDPGVHIFATCGREAVGLCSARFVVRNAGGREVSVAHLGPIGVRAAHRGRGVGRALVAACLRQCRRRGLQAAELDVDTENAAAMHVYRDCGMEPTFRILWYRRELGWAQCRSDETGGRPQPGWGDATRGIPRRVPSA